MNRNNEPSLATAFKRALLTRTIHNSSLHAQLDALAQNKDLGDSYKIQIHVLLL
jgi:hypothetical protein